MKERFPSLIALFLLLVLVTGSWWAADYAQRAIQTDPPRRITHEMDAWSRDFVMLRTDPNGRPINRLEGVYAEHFPDDDSYHVTTPRAVGQHENNPITVAVSKTAVMEQGGKRIIMNGDAHVRRQPDANNDLLDVRSQQLIILPDDDVVYTDLPAEVIKGRSRMNGTGMHYNNKTRQLQVSASTDVEIAGSEGKQQRRTEIPANNTDQKKP
ncbi:MULTISPECIES: LPS export ABC transporter periplasmic protein LptC [Achromobacter]|jgi:lipopolysaccharide export system protein LptC|uniref:Lipopolysaccharide export system protein LptC n=1 Tax=Achromobacter insolitus TaxID=217204 RepID=A0A6S7FA78_9BURK|nr:MULTISPECIES: LPS export ABC transporter periplasmic protein LptC [Achromobacter]APX77586.1 LPS export ABC transporter periplasmic protein LptC [Achromobacter insolitus]AXA73463.1 LPS export ABC transporter periplasmic protein LptC [Achromobacter insolitus]MCP1400007.1 lipopolysaccharide export system protein LptC [Achromobacter insolitus]MDQ6214482.1 LPS export ABC transporter periplasmic protein LptC [Achromobacter insolitus]MEB3094415.1 LPS export ABC transporter periplasmic protein LptC